MPTKLHGTFDLFDVGSAVSVPLGGNAMEQLAEEGSADALAIHANAGVPLIFSAADLIGPMAGQELLALVNELAAGNVYVNVHTEAYPDGEIRGQLALHPRSK
jgi:hypothetical protein